MALEQNSRILQPAAAQHFAPPSPREARAQAVHRLQVGLFGLCAMLLLVGLANIIMDRARQAEEEDPAALEIMPTAAPKPKAADPLADIGVAPAADPSAKPSTGP